MSKKNVVLLLLAFALATILGMNFFGMNAKLAENTYFYNICFYDENNENICDINDTITTNIELGKFEGEYEYYFQVKYECDRELDFENLDFNFAIETSGASKEDVVISELSLEEYQTKFADKNYLFEEKILDENGDVSSYVYSFFYKITFHTGSNININAVIYRNGVIKKQRSIKFGFKAEGQGGESDIDFDFD